MSDLDPTAPETRADIAYRNAEWAGENYHEALAQIVREAIKKAEALKGDAYQERHFPNNHWAFELILESFTEIFEPPMSPEDAANEGPTDHGNPFGD